MIFYAAGLLTGLRPARWYGSRALGILAGVPCVFLVTAVPEFWHAVLCVAAFGFLFGTAAWGTFVAGGAYGPQPRLAQIALGLTLFLGIGVVGAVVGGTTLAMLIDQDNAPWKHYAIDDEGQVIVVTSSHGEGYQVRDLEGREPEQFRGASAWGWDKLDRHVLSFSYMALRGYAGVGGYRDDTRHYIALGGFGAGGTHWYFVQHERRLRGYSRESRRFIGWIGPDGFTPAGQRPGAAFGSRALQSYLPERGMLTLRHGIYQVDVVAHRVAHVFSPGPGAEILGVVPLYGYQREETRAAVALTRDRIWILGPDFRPRFAVSDPVERDKYVSLRVAMMPDDQRYFLEYGAEAEIKVGDREVQTCIVELAADGREVRRYELPSPAGQSPRVPRWTAAAWAVSVPPAVMAAGAGVLAVWAGTHGGLHFRDLGFVLGGPALANVPPTLGAGLLLLASALASAGVCWWLARRYALGKRQQVGWPIAGLFLGLAGVLMFVALREWPAREVCAACGRRRVVDRDTCEHCGAGFAAPVRDGTEIFVV